MTLARRIGVPIAQISSRVKREVASRGKKGQLFAAYCNQPLLLPGNGQWNDRRKVKLYVSALREKGKRRKKALFSLRICLEHRRLTPLTFLFQSSFLAALIGEAG